MSVTITPTKPSSAVRIVRQDRPPRRTWGHRLSSFFRVVGIAVLVFLLLYVGFIVAFHGWYDRWGATDAEVRAELPGDGLITPSS